MKLLFLVAALLGAAVTGTRAAEVKYTLDPGHSQILFSYEHLGYSTNWGMFSGFSGEIVYDETDPGSSSVTVTMPLSSMLTGWEQRFENFMSPDFFNAQGGEIVSFTSTGIEVTSETTAKITGDLFLNSVTRSVVLDAVLNQAGSNPVNGKPWLGFDASTTILRSDFGVGAFAPYISDEVSVLISIEAGATE